MSDVVQKLERTPLNKLKTATDEKKPANNPPGWKNNKVDYEIGIELSSNDTGDSFFNK